MVTYTVVMYATYLLHFISVLFLEVKLLNIIRIGVYIPTYVFIM